MLSTRFLLVGFVSVLALAAVTIGLAALEVNRVEHETLDLADASQHATYYLGEVGDQLARYRSHISLGVHTSARVFRRHAAFISDIESAVRHALHGLPDGLAATARHRWAGAKPEAKRLLRDYREAATAIANGRPARASALLAHSAPMAAEVHDALEQIAESHRETVKARLEAEHRRAAKVVILEFALAGAFLIGMAGIWSLMLGELRGQRRLIADYTERLEAANADLDAFAGRVAHDLRNALGPAAIGGQMLHELSPSPPQLRAITARMDRSTQRALALVDALLAFSRASHAVGPDERAEVPEAIQGAVEDLAPEIARIDVALDADDVDDVRVRCRAGLLHVVVTNLIGNAVKFLEGCPERRVRVSVRGEQELCRIEIEDTGPGIPPELREKIFDPFFRVEGTRAPGTGIGLATVRRIIYARGGRISVTSRDGHGSRFSVWLPLAAPSDHGSASPPGPDSKAG